MFSGRRTVPKRVTYILSAFIGERPTDIRLAQPLALLCGFLANLYCLAKFSLMILRQRYVSLSFVHGTPMLKRQGIGFIA